MDLGLTDRVFVVTAASSGLGLASAQALVAEGARVVLAARRTDALSDAGMAKIEVTAFVSPQAAPAMRDAETVRTYQAAHSALTEAIGNHTAANIGIRIESWPTNSEHRARDLRAKQWGGPFAPYDAPYDHDGQV